MAFFTTDQATALAASTVRVATLVQFDFASGTRRLWNGQGALVAGGQTWEGFAGLGAIDGLEEVRGPVSQKVTFTLSAVDEAMLATALAETSEVQGRLVTVFLQLFDADWQTSGSPFALWTGVMQPPRVTRTAAGDEGGAMRTIALPAENVFFGRSRVPAGRLTDVDQKTRFPGDRFCEQAPFLAQKTYTWPT